MSGAGGMIMSLQKLLHGARLFEARRQIAAIGAGLLLAAAIALPAAAAEYRFNYVMHSNTGQPFWGAVNRGMKDACANLKVDCQMLFLDKDGDFQQVLS